MALVFLSGFLHLNDLPPYCTKFASIYWIGGSALIGRNHHDILPRAGLTIGASEGKLCLHYGYLATLGNPQGKDKATSPPVTCGSTWEPILPNSSQGR